MSKTTHYIGRTAEGNRVWAEIDLRERDAFAGVETIEHETLSESTYTELGVSALVAGYRTHTCIAAGQARDEVAAVVTFALGWSAALRDELLELWDAYHLNGFQAGCAHQTAVGSTSSEMLDQTSACPKTGYRWGSAWLVREIPAEGMIRIRGLQSLPVGPSASHLV